MNKKLIITFVVVMIAIASSVWYFFLRENTEDTENAQPTEVEETTEEESVNRVDVLSLDMDEEYGSVWIENESVMNNVSVQEISDFINDKKESWENESHEYPIGGRTEDGAMWDGASETTIDQPDFMRVIFVELNDEFGEEYEIDLIEEE